MTREVISADKSDEAKQVIQQKEQQVKSAQRKQSRTTDEKVKQ